MLLFSLSNDMLSLNFGFTFSAPYFFVIFYFPTIIKFPKYINQVKSILFFYKLELFYLLILGILFGFLFPWKSTSDVDRLWSQKSEGRSFIQMIRLILDYFLVLICIIIVINLKEPRRSLVRITKYVLVITIFISISDFLLSNQIKQFFFPGSPVIENRFTGFNTEPRTFGRVCSMLSMLIIFLTYNLQKYKHILVVILGIIGVLISTSASAYFITVVWTFLYFVFKKNNFTILFILIISTISTLPLLLQNDSALGERFKKISSSLIQNDEFLIENVDYNEPSIFSSFEVFDRAALNFLYNNPEYIFSGTGPNLISIPASDYIDSFAKKIYGDKIDSVPHTFVINLISSSGLIGFFLWFYFILYFIKKIKLIIPDFYYGAFVTFATTFFVYSNFYLFFIGVILGFLFIKLNISNRNFI